MSSPSVSLFLETIFDEQSRQVSLRVSFRRIEQNTPITNSSNTILDLLEKRGFGNYFIFDDQISLVVNDIAERLEMLQNINDDKDVQFETSVIAEARDATATVAINDDQMQATVILMPARGGKHLDKDWLIAILADNNVVHGIDEQEIFNLLLEARNTESKDAIERLIASGTLPVRGEDTQFIPLVETANERILKPQIRPDGTIDMRELGDLPIVAANEVLMRKQLFTWGEPGTDVLGNDIDAEPGDDFEFATAPGSQINPDNPEELVSVVKGQPNLVKHSMRVDDVVKVKAVDLSTGNLDIDANLMVEGDITECMVVKCTGDITVGGVIESANVEAEGSILVGKGIVGQVPKHKTSEVTLSCSVHAGERIDAVFASYSKLEAQNVVHLDEQLLHCDTTSHGYVNVGNDKTVGSQIVGGITRAKSWVETDVLGSPAGVITRLDLSASYLEMQDQLKNLEKNISSQYDQLSKLRDLYTKMSSQQLSEEQKVQALKLKNTIISLNESIKREEAESQKQREQTESDLLAIQIKAKRRVNPYVEVKIGARKFNSKRAMESGIIAYSDGNVIFKPENIKD